MAATTAPGLEAKIPDGTASKYLAVFTAMEGVQEVREKTLADFYEKTEPHFLWLEEIVGEVQSKLNEEKENEEASDEELEIQATLLPKTPSQKSRPRRKPKIDQSPLRESPAAPSPVRTAMKIKHASKRQSQLLSPAIARAKEDVRGKPSPLSRVVFSPASAPIRAPQPMAHISPVTLPSKSSGPAPASESTSSAPRAQPAAAATVSPPCAVLDVAPIVPVAVTLAKTPPLHTTALSTPPDTITAHTLVAGAASGSTAAARSDQPASAADRGRVTPLKAAWEAAVQAAQSKATPHAKPVVAGNSVRKMATLFENSPAAVSAPVPRFRVADLAKRAREALQEAAETTSEQEGFAEASLPVVGTAPPQASQTETVMNSPQHLDTTADTFATPTQDVTEAAAEHACAAREDGTAAAAAAMDLDSFEEMPMDAPRGAPPPPPGPPPQDDEPHAPLPSDGKPRLFNLATSVRSFIPAKQEKPPAKKAAPEVRALKAAERERAEMQRKEEERAANRQKLLDKAQRAKADEEKRAAEERERRQVEAEKRRQADEAARLKKFELAEKEKEAKRVAREAEVRRMEEERVRQEEEKRRLDEERRQQDEEKRRMEEEARRQEELQRVQQEAARKREEIRRREEELRREEERAREQQRVALEKQRAEAEARRRAEEDARKRMPAPAGLPLVSPTRAKLPGPPVPSLSVPPALVAAPLPTPSNPEDNYDISGLRSDESSDDEDAPKRKIPAWAQGTAFKAALQRQFTQKIDVTGIFPATSPPDLCKIFPMKKRPRYKERTSSAQWAPSPSHPGKLTAL